MDKKATSPFKPIDLSFEEYCNQAVLEIGDGEFFDALDKMFGIEPRTDILKEDESTDQEQ